MLKYFTTARGGRMTPLERTLLMSGVLIPVMVIVYALGDQTDVDRVKPFDLLAMVFAVAAVGACSELGWWIRLLVVGGFVGLLQIGAAQVGGQAHALHTGFMISALLTNGIDALASGRTDLPGFYRNWAAAGNGALWRRLRWGAYYVVSFAVIMTFSVCMTFWVDLMLNSIVPSPGIARTEDWLDYSILAMAGVFAVLMIGRRFEGLGTRIRLLRPALWALAASTVLVAATQVQLLHFHRIGLKLGDWQNAVIKETADDWAKGLLSGLGASAAMIIGFSVLLIPLFILVRAMADRADAEGRGSRLAATLAALGLIVFSGLMGAVIGSQLLGRAAGTSAAAAIGNMSGAVLGLVGAVGWLIWKRARSTNLNDNTLLRSAAPYATGTTTLPADVAAAVDAARSTAVHR